MKANTALAFVLTGLALWLLQTPSKARGSIILRRLCAGLVLLIALLTTIEYLFGWDLGIDQLLFRDVLSPGEVLPGRMAPITAAIFFISSRRTHLNY